VAACVAWVLDTCLANARPQDQTPVLSENVEGRGKLHTFWSFQIKYDSEISENSFFSRTLTNFQIWFHPEAGLPLIINTELKPWQICSSHTQVAMTKQNRLSALGSSPTFLKPVTIQSSFTFHTSFSNGHV
jgi:hypothetical protein